MCASERGRRVEERDVGLASRDSMPSPHSYIENDPRLQHLEAGHLRGLGELRSL